MDRHQKKQVINVLEPNMKRQPRVMNKTPRPTRPTKPGTYSSRFLKQTVSTHHHHHTYFKNIWDDLIDRK